MPYQSDQERLGTSESPTMTSHSAAGLAGTKQAPDGAGLNGRVAGTALLGDTTDRDYSRKLRLFAAFAEPELRAEILLQTGSRGPALCFNIISGL